MKRVYFLFLLIPFFLVLSVDLVFAQGFPAQGRDYYIGYVYPSINKNVHVPNPPPLSFLEITVLISSFYDNNVSITYFDPVTGVELTGQNYGIIAGTTIQVPLNRASMQMSEP